MTLSLIVAVVIASAAASRGVYQFGGGVGAVLKDHFRALSHLDASHPFE